MRGPRELRLYVSRNRDLMKVYRWDDLLIFKLQAKKADKWRYRNEPGHYRVSNLDRR